MERAVRGGKGGERGREINVYGSTRKRDRVRGEEEFCDAVFFKGKILDFFFFNNN